MRTILHLTVIIILGCSSNQSDELSDQVEACLTQTIGSNFIENLKLADKLLRSKGFIKNNSDYLTLYDRAENGEIKLDLTKLYRPLYDSSGREEPFMMYIYTEFKLSDCYSMGADMESSLMMKLFDISRLPSYQAIHKIMLEQNQKSFYYDSVKKEIFKLTPDELDLSIVQLTIVYASWVHFTYNI